jgi:hypothetical protein
MSLRKRLLRWWRDVVLADLKRELPELAHCQRDVPFIRDANEIVVAMTAVPWEQAETSAAHPGNRHDAEQQD